MIQLWHILLVLVMLSLSAVPAWAGDELLKSIMANPDIPPVVLSDGGTPQNNDPSSSAPEDYTSHPWDDPANGYAPNTEDGVSPLVEGQRCTGDARCADQPLIASGTGRGEQYAPSDMP